MKRKKKVSAQILSSKSWQKNFKKMQELEDIEEQLDASYKANRNQTNVQLCSSQVDKGKSGNLSENFCFGENFLGEKFFEGKFFG